MYLRGNRRWMPLLCPVGPYNGLNASVFLSLACIAGALLGKRGERGIFKKTCETCPKRETRGGEKSRRLLPVHCCQWLSRPPTPTSIDRRR